MNLQELNYQNKSQVVETKMDCSFNVAVGVMGESRLIVEELLALCLQRITMEENSVNTEQGETDSLKHILTTLNQRNVTGSVCRTDSEL